MLPPKIDNRTAADLTAEAAALVTRLTGWQPDPAGTGDPGQALLGIFGHYGHLVVERLNQLPDKNFLAFLNLIGAEPLAPEAAVVPLTFTLADGAPVDGVVPAGTQAAAPPRHGDEEEVRYETERELLVSRARLVAARVYDPWTDRTTDCLANALGDLDASFAAFAGTEPVDHELYLACDELLADATGRRVQLDVRTPDLGLLATWPIGWSIWNAGAWQPLAVTAQVVGAGARLLVTIAALPEMEPSTIGGFEARWIRARLDRPLPPAQRGLVAGRAGPVAADRPASLELPLGPFDGGAEWHVDGGDVFGRAGAIALLDLTVAPGAQASADLVLGWDYLARGGTWKPLGRSSPANPPAGSAAAVSDGTGRLTSSGAVELRLPDDWAREDHGNRRGRWLRVTIAGGAYRVPPTVTGLSFGWRWELPRIDRVVVTVDPPAARDPSAPLAPELGFAGTRTLDLGLDIAPFGSQPDYNDAFYLACEPVLAGPGRAIQVSLGLTNPAGGTDQPVPRVRTAGNPVLAWEMYTALGWRVLLRSPAATPATGSAQSFTADGSVTLTIPAEATATEVNGVARHWLRVRVVGGNYGEPARVTGDATSGYRMVPATFAAPLVRELRLTVANAGGPVGGPAAGSSSRPVTACTSANGGNLVDHAAVAGASDGRWFAPFRPLEVTEAALYLGFDQPFAARPVSLFVQVEGPRPEDVAAEMLMGRHVAEPARVVWEYGSSAGWSPLGPLDGTADLTRSGLVRFIGPDDLTPREWLGRELHWLAARWRGGDHLFPPAVRQMRLNTVWASAATTSRDEILGSSSGEPGQRFTTVNRPVLVGEELDVDEGGAWVRWQAVVDLHASSPDDRHYALDRRAGTVVFGDGGQGRIPPLGRRNIRLTRYRWGGGDAGNREAGEIVELKSSPPYIAGVVNHDAAAGGFDEEPLARVKERGPASLRHRDRAVTAQDLQDLAAAASPEVARAAVILPDFDSAQLWLGPDQRPRAAHRAAPAGQVGVIIVPHSAGRRPTPGLALLDQVRQHLLERSSLTAELWVAGPEWVAVAVDARVVPISPDEADALVAVARRRIDAYLHPLTGGTQGRGWAFGTVPRRSDLYRVLEATPGVDHVRTLGLTITPVSRRGNVEELTSWLQRRETGTSTLTPDERERNSWAQRSLVYAAEHNVRAVLRG